MITTTACLERLPEPCMVQIERTLAERRGHFELRMRVWGWWAGEPMQVGSQGQTNGKENARYKTPENYEGSPWSIQQVPIITYT